MKRKQRSGQKLASRLGIVMEPGLGDRVRERREALGLSKRAVARAARLSDAFIVKLERGDYTTVSVATLAALAVALHCTPADLWPESVPLVQPDDPELLRRIEEQRDWLDELSPQTRRIAIQNMIEGLENRRRRELAEEKRRRREEAHPDDPPTSAAG